MDGDRGRAGGLAHTGKLHGVDVPAVPALAEFHRDGDVDRPDHGLDDLPREDGVAHEGAAVAAFDDLADRAAHVDIQNVRPGERERHRRGLRHDLRLVAEDLRRDGAILRRAIEQRLGFFVAVDERAGADHLGAGERRPLPITETAEGRVRHARHRRERHAPGDGYGSYVHKESSKPTGQWSLPSIWFRIKASSILSAMRSETRK